ncbi:MAG TPA: DUF892 family protein, partial [Verrucomicrobiae bacterium]|nr:DUF892 family protein [Verrucomicrobiae bacterium]
MESLFLNEMRQMYDSENQLINALAELEKYSMSKLLKLAFHHHLKQTYKHVERLKEAFEELGETAHRKPCDGMEG